MQASLFRGMISCPICLPMWCPLATEASLFCYRETPDFELRLPWLRPGLLLLCLTLRSHPASSELRLINVSRAFLLC